MKKYDAVKAPPFSSYQEEICKILDVAPAFSEYEKIERLRGWLDFCQHQNRANVVACESWEDTEICDTWNNNKTP